MCQLDYIEDTRNMNYSFSSSSIFQPIFRTSEFYIDDAIVAASWPVPPGQINIFFY